VTDSAGPECGLGVLAVAVDHPARDVNIRYHLLRTIDSITLLRVVERVEEP
jgi:hypothetical protein